jgi:hypothetical protein
MHKNSLRLAALVSFFTLAACHNSSSSSSSVSTVPVTETEPNGTFAEANPFQLNQNITGSLDSAGDADWWQLDLTAGHYITVQAFVNRFDQAGWVTNGSMMRFTLYDTDGTTVLLQQSADDFSWWDTQDTDVALWRVPATGTYFLALEQEDTATAAGDYIVSVTRTTINETIQMELEPAGMTGGNDTTMTAETIANGMVQGWHVDDESDFFQVTTTVPGLLRFSVVGHRNGVSDGDTYYDPELELYDAMGASLINNDDTYYLDSAIQHLALTPATFFIEVTECCASGDAPYQLFYDFVPATQLGTAVAESEPNDALGTAQAVTFGTFISGTTDGEADFYAFACNAGDRIEFEFFFDAEIEGGLFFPAIDIQDGMGASVPFELSGSFANARMILTTAGTYYLKVGDTPLGGGTSPYSFRISQTRSTFETEPNDSIAHTGTFDSSNRAAGMMDAPSDVDTYSFTATEGHPVVFDVLASSSNSTNGFFNNDGFGSTMDPLLTILDDMGTVLVSVDSDTQFLNGVVDGLPTATLYFVPPSTGTFFLQVEESYGDSGTDTYYTVEMR